MKAETPLPPGAMYLLLLIGHMTLAVAATTPGLTTQDLQTHINQSDAVTNAHVDASSKHTATTTGARGAPVTHTVHRPSETQTHVAPHHGHVSSTEPPHVTTKALAERNVSVHHPTYVSHSDSIRRPPAVTHMELPSTHSKTQATKVMAGSASAPVLSIDIIDKIHHFTCVWDLGPQDTHYQLVQGDTMVEDIAVHGKEAAVFKYNIPPGPIELHCRVRTPSGEMLISNPMRIVGSVSAPVLSIDIIDKIHHFKCVWDLGPQDTHYELVQGDTMVEDITVHGKEAAVFKYNIPPGPIELHCRVRTPSGEMLISNPMRIVGDTTESEGKAQDKTKPDTEERDASPNFLIPLNKILTSVTQPVQDRNAIIISVCGPVVLVVLLIVFITHFRNRQEHKLESSAA